MDWSRKGKMMIKNYSKEFWKLQLFADDGGNGGGGSGGDNGDNNGSSGAYLVKVKIKDLYIRTGTGINYANKGFIKPLFAPLSKHRADGVN